MMNAISRNTKVLGLLVLFFCTTIASAQLTTSFRIVSVSSDIDDMDPAGGGANGGASDPQWDYQMTDVPFGNNFSSIYNIQELNCPGTFALSDTFFTQSYAAGCNTPTDYTFEWSGVDSDVPGVVPNPLGGASATQIINIPALSLTYPSGGWVSLGTYSVTAPGTDCGSTGTVTWSLELEYFTVGATESILPTVSCLPGTVTQNVDPGTCSSTVFGIAPVAVTDNCGIGSQTWIFSGATVDTSGQFGIFDASGQSFNGGVTTVTYTVMDYSSNAASCSFTITIVDTEAPTVVCPANATQNIDIGNCTAVVNGLAPMAADNCLIANQTWTMAGATVGTSPATGINDVSGETFNLGVTTITYVVDDSAGFTANCSFTVTVLDNESPTITCPINLNQGVDAGNCTAVVNGIAAAANDNCSVSTVTWSLAGATVGNSPAVGINDASGQTFNLGTTFVTYVVTDGSGNTANCSFNVTVTDNELPTIVCPADINANNDAGLCGAIINFVAPVGVDNCPGAGTSIIAGQNSGTFFPLGVTTVTYEVTDASANTAQCSFDVTIIDTELPVINCPGDIIVPNGLGQCGRAVGYATPVGTDNCPGAVTVLTAGLASGSFFPIGTTVITYEVTDGSANTSSCSFNIIVNDTEVPTIACPANITVSNDPGSCDAVVNYVAPVGADNCPASVTNMIAGLASGSAFPVGTTTITFEVTDASANTAQCSFDVIVNDTENPTIACPADITVNNDPGSCDAVVNYVAPVGADNCPGSVTNMIAGLASGSTFPVGTTTVTFEVTDASANTAQCSFDVIVNDTELPTIACPANITVGNDPGLCGSTVNFVTPVGTDNCPGSATALITLLGPGDFYPIGSTVVTYEVTDASGNTAQCSFDVIVNDTELPTIVCPADINTNSNPGTCGKNVNYGGAPTGIDNCPGSVTTLIAGQASNTFFTVGTTVVTYEVVDASGNTAQCSFNVTMNDVTDPNMICPPVVNVNNDPGLCGAIATYGAVVISDNCPGETVAQLSGQASGTFFPIGSTVNLWEVTDASGNTDQCTVTVTVVDNEVPTIVCPADIIVNSPPGTCTAVVNYVAPIGADNCPGPVTNMIAGLASGSAFPVGTTTITFEVTDASGNTAQCSFDVIVNDIDIPTIVCPADITVNNDAGLCGATVNFVAPVGNDNCPGSITSLITILGPGDFFPIGSVVVTYEVVDVSGNSAQCSFDVIVNDTELPTIVCPANIIVANNLGSCDAVVNYAPPVGSDNCPGAVTNMIAGLASGSTFPVGTTTITFEVTDASANVAQCSFDVTVNDIELPTIACPANITVSNDPGSCDAVVNYVAPVGADNCPGAVTSMIAGLASGSTFPIGTTTMTFEVIDASGNTAQCSFDVIVNDTEFPTIACPANITVANDFGVCDAVVVFAAPVGADNCPGAITTLIAGFAPGSTFPVGTTTVTYEVTDASGNSAQCSFDVTVNDTENPTIVCPANITVGNDAGLCGATVNFVAPVGIDNCPASITSLITILGPGDFFPIGSVVVTYEVIDATGNSAQCSFDVIVNDTELPTIVCPANITVSNDPGACDAIVNYVAPIGSDNCPGAVTNLIAGLASGSTFPVGTTTITFEVTDASANTAQCSFDVIVNDTELPTLACPANITVGNDPGSCDAVVNYVAPTGNDNCPGAVTSLFSGLASGSTFPLGTTTITYEVIDASGNSAQCSFDVTVNDSELPTIVCPANITVGNTPGGCGAIVNFVAPIGNDNCPGSITSQISVLGPGDFYPIGTTTVTYEVIDASGNTAQCSFDVTVNDTQLPTIACPVDIIVNNDAGSCDAVVNYTAPVGIDNCPASVTIMTAGLISGSAFPIGTTIVTFEVTDASGNTAQCSFNVTVIDNENPVLACPADITVSNDPGSCDAVVIYVAPIGTDNCPGTVTNMIAGLISGSTFPIGTTTITFEATDVSANVTQCSFDVIVNDTELPTIACPADIIVNNNPGSCDAVVNYVAPVGADNCPGSVTSMIAGLASGSTFPLGTTVVTFEVIDASGNAAQCSFNVTVNDTELPTIVCPGNITVPNIAGGCGAIVNFAAPVGNDNCPGSITSLITILGPGDFFPIGSVVVTYEVVDASGNSAQCSFDVIVNDTELPTIACPVDITQGNDPGICGAIITYAVSVGLDNCPGSVTVITSGQASGTVFPVGTTTVTYEVTDASSNVASCSFNVTVNDTESPLITCPANITVSNDPGSCDAVVNYVAPVGTDNCPAPVTNMIAGLASGSTFPIGTTTITFEVTDASANTTQCSFDVIVNDDELPTITCPADVVVNNDAGSCDAIVNYVAPVGADNCPGGVTSLIAGLASGSAFPIGTTTVTYEVLDASGNSAQCSFDVTVNDTEVPTIVCPANIVVGNDAGLCGATVNFAAPVGVDNCLGSVTSLITILGPGAFFPIGSVVVTYEVVDGSGNAAQCSFDVIVNDTELPTIACPADIVISNDPGLCGAIVNYITPAGNDNCPGSTTSMLAGQLSGTIFPVGTTLVTYEVVDASANVAQCSFNVTINDTELPTIVCPTDIIVSNDPGACGAIVNYTAPVGADNCPASATLMTGGLATGSLFPIGTTIITFEVTDASGNVAQCSFNVTVNDTELPTIVCPADIVQNNDAGACGAVVNYVAPIGADSCPGAVTVMTAGLASGSVFPIGVTVVTFEVTDGSGNVANCSFNVTIDDNEFPTIACPADVTLPNDPGSCGAIVTYIVPVGADNCPGSTTTMAFGQASGTVFPNGVTPVIYEVVDASGNITQCSFTVTITDTENPTILCPADMIVSNDIGVCGAIVNFVAPVGLDNCPGAVTSQIAGLASGSLFPIGTTTITFEVTDGIGNTAQCSFDITVNDTELPVIVCPANITQNNDLGVCGGTVVYTAPVGTDNCAGVSTSLLSGLGSGSLFPGGVTTVTYEAIDLAGNSAQCSFDVTIDDVEAPTINCPANITVNNTAGTCSATVVFADPVVVDNCTSSSFSLIAGLVSGSIFPVGTTTNTFEAVDLGGNTAQCSFDIVVVDAEVPIIICPADITVSNDPGNCDAVVTFANATVIDNCPGGTVAQIAGPVSGSSFPIGTTLVTFEATDNSGNTAQCSFNVTVNDTENPTISCPPNSVANNDPGTCGATVIYGAPVGNDNCPGSITSLITGLPSGSLFPGGVNTITYEVVDGQGNSSQCSFDVTVIDTEPPTVACPADITISNDLGVCGATVNYGAPFITDNCPGVTVNVISGLTSGSLFPIGTTNVILEVVDISFNNAQCQFSVTVIDTEVPQVVCPGNQSVTANANCEFVLADYTGMATGLDNCGAVTFTQNPAANTLLTAGTTVTMTGTDSYGNTATCTFDVTAIDNIAPIITCPPSDTVYMTVFCDYTTTDFSGLITVVENCGAYNYFQTPVATSILTADTLVQIMVVDLAGNTSTCSYNLAVVDSTPPIVTCPPSDLEVFFTTICDFVVQDYSGSISTFDNCGLASLTQSPAPGGAITGPTPIMFTGVDINGNSTQCSFNVIPLDTIPPTMSCPPDQIAYRDTACENVLADYTSLAVVVATCETIAIAQTPPPGTIINSDITVALSGTDFSGNVSFCAFNLVLLDTISPEVTCAPDIFSCDSIVDYAPPLATDNCGVSTLVRIVGPPPLSIFPVGATLITYEATDASGNTDTCSFFVNVLPNPQLSLAVTDISCFGQIDGAIDATVTSGSTPFFYEWSNGPTTEDVSGLLAGNYTLIVTDKFGCTDTISDSIIEPALLQAGYNISPTGCFGALDGYINVTNVQGGTTPYNFIWSPAVGAGTNAVDLLPGVYTVSIVDAHGCSKDTTITIIQSDSIFIDGEVSMYENGFNISEENGADGWIQLDVSGGTQPYVYSWDTGQNDGYISGLIEGLYTVTVIDDFGCEQVAYFQLNAPINIIISNGMSPNGDGLNDIFFIENIEQFPNSHLMVMNRWGDVVYEMNNYQNDWDGKANKGLILYGNRVPEGSYYYILDPGDELYQKMSGYLIINGY